MQKHPCTRLARLFGLASPMTAVALSVSNSRRLARCRRFWTLDGLPL